MDLFFFVISVQVQCHRAKVVIIPLLPRDKSKFLKRYVSIKFYLQTCII